MRKLLYVIRKMWRIMGWQHAILLVLTLLFCFCLHYSMSFPILYLRYYARYDGTGLDNSAIFCANYALASDWFQEPANEKPKYHELTEYLNGLGDVVQTAELGAKIGDDWFRLIVYDNALIERVNLPLNALAELRAYNDPEQIPLILDYRLNGVYNIGDEVDDIFIIGCDGTFRGKVLGFLDQTNELLTMSGGASRPTIQILTEYNSDIPFILTVSHSVLPFQPSDYVSNSVFLFPKNGERVDDLIGLWREDVNQHGYGSILSYREMKHADIVDDVFKESGVLFWMAFWCFVLLLVGLQGYIVNIAFKIEKQMAVYKMLGMQYRQWIVSFGIAYSFPILLVIALSEISGMLMLGEVRVIRLIWPYMTVISVGFGLIMILPAVCAVGIRWRTTSIAQLIAEKEGLI